MNPEFRRNLWLELTPRRMASMAVALALIFFAASLSGTLAQVAVLFYNLIVVLWGSRNAALSVVGEIRGRTWDGQRLSSLSAGRMMWGKLFGATLYTWFGGAICLVVILADTVATKGIYEASIALAYYLTIGIIAQAAAFLASLVAVIREKSHTRLDVFFYQFAGLLAAMLASWMWWVGDPEATFLFATRDANMVVDFGWWGMRAGGALFLLLSLAAFAGWLLVGCWRLMRIELMQRNGPWVWIGFLVFVGVYVAGFDGVMFGETVLHVDYAQARWWQAGLAFAALGYVMVFLEPKNSVLYRWMAGQLVGGRIGSALAAVQGWTVAWFAALICAVALIVSMGMAGNAAGEMQLAALFGFFTRDLALVMLVGMLTKRYGDLAGLTVLAVLYVLLPMILEGMRLDGALVLLRLREVSPAWIAPVVTWGEAVLAVVAVAMSMRAKQSTEA